MPIPQRRITDRESFLEVTRSPRDTAALYFHKQLDPYYESALVIAGDFVARPQLYTGIADSDVVRKLAELRARCGSDELFPSRHQRMHIYSAVFGEPGATDNFDKLRDDLIDAAKAFSERVFDTGVEMLRARVRTAHRPLKDYLTGATGSSTSWSAMNPLDHIAEDVSYRIFRTGDIAAVFGITTAPRDTWPYTEDSNADKLLEELTKRKNDSIELMRQEASNRQRLAARGAEAVAAVIDYAENVADPADDIASLDILITQCYTWGAARDALHAPPRV